MERTFIHFTGVFFCVLSALCTCCGCARESLSATDTKPRELKPEDFPQRLIEIAGEYKSYTMVQNRVRLAPALCRAPIARPNVSASTDETTHGRKLFYLFAADFAAYEDVKRAASPVGQTLVKESWTAEKITADEVETKIKMVSHASGTTVRPAASTVDGHTFKTGKQADLFIMFKLAPATPGTDNGWVYGTVTPDGKKVTSAGRIESCMNCHKDAPHDRLYVVKPQQH